MPGRNCSAWMRSFRPCFFAAVRTVRHSSTVKAWSSQKASQYCARSEFGDFRDEFFGNEADVVGAAVFVFGRDGVGGEQRGDDARRAFFVEAANHAEHLQFGLAIEAVAGFGFYGRGAVAQHPVAMAAGGGEKFIFSGGTGEGDGAQDASASCGDLLVGGAGDALLEFCGAVASEDEMGVGIDEAGGYAALCRRRCSVASGGI